MVADARYRELRTGRLDFYMSYLQANHRVQHVIVRTRGADPTAVAADIRAIVHAVDPNLPVDDVVTVRQVVDRALGGPRFAARVFVTLKDGSTSSAHWQIFNSVSGGQGI